MADQDGTLTLAIVDVFNGNIQEDVTIVLKNQQVVDNRTLKAQSAADFIRIGGLWRAPQGRYMIEVDAPSYHAVSQFININASGDTALTIMLPVDPARVTSMQRPAYADLLPDLKSFLANAEVLGFSGKKDQALYDALPDIPCAGLLNLVAKARHTLIDGKPALASLGVMVDLHGDRLFAMVEPDFKSVCSRATDVLHPADDSLHNPQPGFVRAGSFKTFDLYGNLQLTFSVNQQDQTQWMVDMDIDDAQGLEHIFQVVRNFLTGEPTHPYNIHEILIAYQQLDPGYTLSVDATHQAMAAKA
jgi:hypothetical protein